MQRPERAIVHVDEIKAVIRQGEVLHLAMHDQEYPYVVPLSYGYHWEQDQLTLYVHGAKVGKKHTLLAQNNKVCVEISNFNGYARTPQGITTQYESIIAYGELIEIHDQEAMFALSCLVEHCGYQDEAISEQVLPIVNVYKIHIHEISGKRRKV